MPNRQRVRFQNGILVEIGYRHFGRRHQKGILAFQLVEVILELRQLARTGHRFAIDDGRHPNLFVAMLVGVHIQHELEQRPLQSCRAPLQYGKPAASQLGASFKIENTQIRADIPMRRHRIGSGLAPAAQFHVIVFAVAFRHRRMQRVGNLEQHIGKRGLGLLGLGFQLFDLSGHLAHRGNLVAGILAAALLQANQLRNPVALGLQCLGFAFQLTLPGIQRLRPPPWTVLGNHIRPAPGQRALHLIK